MDDRRHARRPPGRPPRARRGAAPRGPVRPGGLLPLAVPLAVLVAVLCGAPPLPAAVYNIHLYTDSTPDHTDRASFLETATGVWTDPQDRAIALWRWLVRERRQTSATFEDGRGLWDPVLVLNSYGNTYCAFTAAMLQSWADGMGAGWTSRYLELGDHTVSELSWSGGAAWHLLDGSMCIYCLDETGGVASAQDVQDAHTSELAAWLGETGPVPGHHYLYNFAPECGSNPVNPAHAGDLGYPWGYRIAVDNPVPYARTLRNGADSYLTGFEVQEAYSHIRQGWRHRLHLRRHEHYTRHWGHLGETEDHFRPNSRGVDPDDGSPLGDMRGNGRWVLAPDLASPDYRLVIHDESGIVHRDEDGWSGPCLRPAAAGAAAAVSFQVHGANVITSGALHLEAVRETAADSLLVSVSTDAGINWQPVWTAAETGVLIADIPLPAALLGGAYEYLVRVRMRAAADRRDCGLDALRLETVTQLNPLALPRLVRGANQVRLFTGPQQETQMLWPPLHDDGDGPQYLETADSHANLDASADPHSFATAILRPVSAAGPGQVTWRLETPTDLVGLEYGGSFLVRPSTPGAHVDLLHSVDGVDWILDAVYDGGTAPTWDGRLHAAVASLPPGSRTAWLRYRIHSPQDLAYDSPGIQDVLMTVASAPRDPVRQRVEVTFCWTEHRAGGDAERRHTHLVDAEDESWLIDVGGLRDPTMNWVRVNLAGQGPDGDAVVLGYSDGEDVGPGAGYDRRRYRFRWQDNVAFERPYSVSRAGAAANPDAGGELTDGCIVPPTTYNTSWAVQEQTAFWDGDAPVTVTLDLGAPQTVAAVRITTHQPNGTWCHADSIEVLGSVDGATYAPLGVIRHADLWSPPGDFLPWEHDGSPSFAGLPAGGRLAYAFWLVPASPATARYLRCRFQPLPGRGVGISEIQAFDAIAVEDWPDREVWMPTVVGVAPGGAGDQGAVRPPGVTAGLLTCEPNPFNARAAIRFRLPTAGPVELVLYDAAGRRIRSLLHRTWRAAGTYDVHWDGRDGGGRTVASGVYLCRLRAGDADETIRLVLVR